MKDFGFYVEGPKGDIYVPAAHEMRMLANDVTEQMIAAEYYPDMTLAIANGGIPVARDIEHFFAKLAGHVPEPASIKLQSYEETGSLQDTQGDGIKLMNEILPPHYNPKKVLIIDDMVDTGETGDYALKWAKEKFGNEVDVRLGVLWWKECSKITPDFFGERVDPGWILLYKDFKDESYDELYARRII